MKEKISQKLISVILAAAMIAVLVPFAFAAEPVVLSESNISVWPTTSGEIYFGQKICDGITLSGGEVQYNGVVVPGHFEFNDINFMPTSSGNKTSSIKFIPDDTSEFVGFSIETCWDVTYTVKKQNLFLLMKPIFLLLQRLKLEQNYPHQPFQVVK